MSAGLTLHWSDGNEKLKRTRVVSFNLPAFRSADGFVVCPGAAGCANVCYARQGRLHQVRRQFELCTRAMESGLGCGPSEATAALYRSIRLEHSP